MGTVPPSTPMRNPVSGFTFPVPHLTANGRPRTGYAITKTHAEGGRHDNTDAIDAVKVAPIPSSDHRLPVPEQAVEQTAPPSRVPGNRQARSKVMPIHVVGILTAGLADWQKPDPWRVSLAGKSCRYHVVRPCVIGQDGVSFRRVDHDCL